MLFALLAAFTIRYGDRWTPRGLVVLATLVLTTAALIASSVLLDRRRDVAGLLWFAAGIDAFAVMLTVAAPISHPAVAPLPLLGCAAMLGVPSRRTLLRT